MYFMQYAEVNIINCNKKKIVEHNIDRKPKEPPKRVSIKIKLSKAVLPNLQTAVLSYWLSSVQGKQYNGK